MGLLEIIVVCLAIIAIAALLVYYYMDYQAHKDDNTTRFAETDKAIGVQGANNRELLGDLKAVVDQQNAINATIYTSFSGYSNLMNANMFDVKSLLSTQTGKVSQLASVQDNYMLGMSNVFTLGSVIDTGMNTPAWSSGVFSLPGVRNPDVRLMNHVTAVSGVTIRDLKNEAGGTARLNICSATNGKCIKIPDENGNTLITTMVDDKDIVIDGNMVAKKHLLTQGNLGVDGRLVTNGDLIAKADINATKNLKIDGTFFLNGKQVSINSTTGALSVSVPV